MSSASPDLALLLGPRFDSEEEAARWIEPLLAEGAPEAAHTAFRDALLAWFRRLQRTGAAAEPESFAQESSELSACLLDWLEADGLEADEDRYLEAVRTWSALLNGLLAEHGLPLRFRRVLPQQRFDHDRMESVASHSGHHLRIARPLAWIVCEDTEDGSRILRRARVTTT